MDKLKKKLLSGIAAGSLLLNLVTPVAAASYTISGNNSDSQNYIDVDLDRDVDVDQNNDADVDNDVTISASTGGNQAKDIAGGDVSIDTGSAEVGVQIENSLNSNMATLDLCGGCGLDGDFKIAGNNSDTDNDIKYDYDQDVDVDQDNDADVDNDVDVTADSGWNKVKDVVGGDVSVDTGDVTVNPVIVKNSLNSNVASVGLGGNEDAGLSAWIIGNNSDSENFIDLDYDSDLDVDQDNDADVENDVTVAADSGWNRVKDVSGAGVTIDTGDVEVGVLVDTMANFNLADVEDCCLLDLDLKIAENNSDTDNDIELDLDADVDLDQDNDFDCDGGYGFPHLSQILSEGFGGGYGGGKCSDVDVSGSTGDNKVKDSTAGGHDPEIDTGSVGVAVEVLNEANVNVGNVGEGGGSGEGSGSGSSVEIDIDFGELEDLLRELLELLG